MIDAAPEGATFHLAARTYRFSAPIVPKAGDRLIGAGAGVTVLDGGGSGSNGIDTMGGIADAIVGEFLTVTGFNDGIRIGPAWQVTGVEAMGNVTGLQFAGFAGAAITDASAHDNGRFGIHGSSDQGRVISSEVFRNHTDASWPSGFSGGLKIVGCSARVRNTWIHDNYGVGLWFDEEVHDAVATGNGVANNDDDGVQRRSSTGVELLNNTVIGSVVAFNSSSTLVRGNVISAPSSIDVLVRFMGNGRLQEGVEFMNAHNRAVGNTVSLVPGQSVGVVRDRRYDDRQRTSGTTAIAWHRSRSRASRGGTGRRCKRLTG